MRLLCIGLDRFRLFNSVYGYRIGDRMLAAVAARLRKAIRLPNLLGRRGGDEIVALLVDIDSPDLVAKLARDIVETICQPERLGNIEISVRASVGVGFFPNDGGDLDGFSMPVRPPCLGQGIRRRYACTFHGGTGAPDRTARAP